MYKRTQLASFYWLNVTYAYIMHVKRKAALVGESLAEIKANTNKTRARVSCVDEDDVESKKKNLSNIQQNFESISYSKR